MHRAVHFGLLVWFFLAIFLATRLLATLGVPWWLRALVAVGSIWGLADPVSRIAARLVPYRARLEATDDEIILHFRNREYATLFAAANDVEPDLGDGGFHEYVTNPGYRRLMQDHRDAERQEEDRLRQKLALDESSPMEEIELRVDMLLDPRRAAVAYDVLQTVGLRAARPLVSALTDDRYLEPDEDGDRPLELVLRLLSRIRTPEAQEPLEALWNRRGQHMDLQFSLAEAICSLGSGASIALVLRVLEEYEEEDPFPIGNWYFTRGVGRWAFKASDADRARLFDGLVAAGHDHPVVLLKLDRDRAIPYLQSVADQGVDAPALGLALVELRKAGVPLSVPKLHDLLQQLRDNPPADSPPRGGNFKLSPTRPPLAPWKRGPYEAITESLAAQGDESVMSLLEEDMECLDDFRRRGAAEDLCRLCRVEPDPIRAVGYRETEFGSLPAPQRHVVAVTWLDREVRNGGVDQFWVNPYGSMAADALAGLQAMGAKRCAEIFEREMARFGPEGPSPDRDTRHRQLARIADPTPRLRRDDPDDFDSQWYGDPDNLQVKLRVYAIEHAELFPPQPEGEEDEL